MGEETSGQGVVLGRGGGPQGAQARRQAGDPVALLGPQVGRAVDAGGGGGEEGHRAQGGRRIGHAGQVGPDPLEGAAGHLDPVPVVARAAGHPAPHGLQELQEAQVPDIFKVLDQIADRTPAGANGVIYTPWIWGERAPIDDHNVRAGLYNLSLHNTREDIIRAFLEGVALNTRWLLKPVTKFLGRRVPTINIVGGGAQSDVWCQIFADVLNTQIRQVQDPIYANARGAAWIAAVGLGKITFADVPQLVTFNRLYDPNPAHRSLYDERFAVFQQIYQKMKGVYKQLNR